MDAHFRPYTLGKRLKSMLKVDLRRMFSMRLVYILVASCLVMPILILVMTTMMDGIVSVNPQTGEETVIEGFDNVWQIIGSVSSGFGAPADPNAATAAMDMSITSMCNINMLYFILAVLVCVFVSDDFRSGYAKNLFTVRAKKGEYVASKTIVCCIGAGLMILAFVLGSVIGGAVTGLPFTMEGFDMAGLLMCVLSKVLLVAVFVPIYLIMAVIARQKLWLSLLLSFMTGMFLFMMIPMLTPLNATAVHILLCLAGSLGFGFGLGAGSKKILESASLV